MLQELHTYLLGTQKLNLLGGEFQGSNDTDPESLRKSGTDFAPPLQLHVAVAGATGTTLAQRNSALEETNGLKLIALCLQDSCDRYFQQQQREQEERKHRSDSMSIRNSGMKITDHVQTLLPSSPDMEASPNYLDGTWCVSGISWFEGVSEEDILAAVSSHLPNVVSFVSPPIDA